MKRLMHLSQHGQSMVEFALILPIFVLLSVFIFDFGRGIYDYSAIHNAAREGARYGIIHPTDYTGMENTAIQYAIGLGLSTADVNATPGAPEYIAGTSNPTVKVTISYKFTPATPLVSTFLPCGCDYLILKSDAIMRTEVLPTQ